jgi:hypothetical protein
LHKSNSLSIIGNRLFESFAAAFTTAKKMTRAIHVLGSHAKRVSTEPKNSITWTRRAALWRWRAHQWFESLKANLPRSPEVRWKRYALLTFLLVSLTLEVFLFGGANTILAPDYMLRPGPGLNDAVDAMFVRMKQEPITTTPADTKKEQQQATAVTTINARPKAPEPSARPKAPEPSARPKVSEQQIRSPVTPKNPPAASQLASTDTARSSSFVRTAPEKQTVVAAVKEPSVGEPIVSTRNVDNNPAKIQLNIKWEN